MQYKQKKMTDGNIHKLTPLKYSILTKHIKTVGIKNKQKLYKNIYSQCLILTKNIYVYF